MNDLFALDDMLNGDGEISDLFIIEAQGCLFLGYLSAVVNREAPIKDFEEWRNKSTINLLDISLEFSPQTIMHSNIKAIKSVRKIIIDILGELKADAADIQVPFIGVIHNDNFKDWFMVLHDKQCDNVYTAAGVVRDHYTKLIKSLTDKKKAGEE